MTLAAQPNPLCAIEEAVTIAALRGERDGSIDLPDRPILACATALVLADFAQSLLTPLAKGVYGAAIRSLSTGPGFDCRSRDHVPGAKISAHAQGLAIDIAKVTLSDGRSTEIGVARTEEDRLFDKAARAGACGFFHTALGPGADRFHETHWHFDLVPRGSQGDTKLCQ